MAESRPDFAIAQRSSTATDNDSPVTSNTESVIWRTMHSPVTLLVIAGLLLLAVVPLFFLPQMPDQIQSEPAEAARWTMDTASDFGAMGQLANALGLFDVLNSPVFRILLALLTLLIAAHLADAVGDALVYRQCRQTLYEQPNNGEQPPWIWRRLAPFGHRSVIEDDYATLTKRWADAVALDFADGESVDADSAADLDESSEEISSESDEWRAMADKHGVSYFLRPFLPFGILIMLSLVWLYVFFGWQLSTAVISPGETYQASNYDLTVSYDITAKSMAGGQQDAPASAVIHVQYGSRTYTTTVSSNLRTMFGANQISFNADTPGVIVSTVGSRPLLVAPGDTSRSDTVGVVLPSPGSEAALLIPSASIGLRLVRLTDDPTAIIAELYQGSDIVPVERIDISNATTTTIGSGDRMVSLAFVQSPGVEVTIRHSPGSWLIWPALLCILVGAYTLWSRPKVILAQLRPWQSESRLITLCASQQAILAQVIERMEDGVEQTERTDGG